MMIVQDVVNDVVSVCRNHPQILIFLSLAIGYYVGKIKVGGFSLGSTASVLLAALVLGQVDVTITPLIKDIAFALFIFTIGYKVGPQFFGGLKKEGVQYVALSFFVAIVGLVTAIVLSKILGFDKGTTAGLLGGAMTQSSIIGTAQDAIQNLSVSSAQKSMLDSHIAVAYAITYIFGVAGLILFYKIVPRLLKMNLKAEAQKVEAQLSGAPATQGSQSQEVRCPIDSNRISVYVTQSQFVGKTIGFIQKQYGSTCSIVRITRQGHELPLKKGMVVAKYDLLLVCGVEKDLELFGHAVGCVERNPNVTDLSMIGLGCFLGTLVGLAMIKIGYISLTLGIGGGVLLSGLLFGWFRSIHPTFGHIPEGAQWLLSDLGLNLFIACVGLTAGPNAVHALKTQGATLFFAGVVLTLMPHILGLIFGKLVLRLNPILLLGALTGAGTATPSLNVLKNESDSSAPALGYTVPYAIGNFILTIWGTVVINFM